MTETAYIQRMLSDRFFAYLRQFPAVLLLGARQVGKSTFLSHVLREWESIDLERPGVAERIQADIGLFLKDHSSKVWFDEAQRVPELFSALRWHIDQDRTPGRFVLSGSASPALQKEVSESLAGRIGILELGPLSLVEKEGRAASTFLKEGLDSVSAVHFLEKMNAHVLKSNPRSEIRQAWLHGGYPEPSCLLKADQAWRWFDSYVRTVSERDIQGVAQGLGPVSLSRFLRMLAARHGQCLHESELARDFGVSVKTAGRYLEALEGAFLWRRLLPYFANMGKRLVKSSKGYMVDSGLLHHLLGVSSWESLEVHPLLGASWEGWVIEQLLRQAQVIEPMPAAFYWRTHAGAEVDLVLESANRLLPMEIKHRSNVGPMETRGIRHFLSDFSAKASWGIILYRGDEMLRVESDVVLVPAEMALSGGPPSLSPG